jgi:hypothetical protein
MARETRSTSLRWLVVALVLGALSYLFWPRVREPSPDRLANSDSTHQSKGRSTRWQDDEAPHQDEGAHGSKMRSSPSSNARVLNVGQADGWVEGEVRSSETGEPVGGAELSFERDEVVVSVTSDSEGRYHFEPAQAGAFRITSVSAEGYLPFAPEWGQSAVRITVTQGQRIENATLFLRPATVYTGVVLSSRHEPVAGADVQLYAASTDAALMPMQDSYKSDAQGQFQFRAPPDTVLEARHAREGTARARIDFAAEVTQRVELVLSGKAGRDERLSISGRVLGPGGAPVEHAVVSAEQERDTFGGDNYELPAHTASDAEGEYELTKLEPGTYTISATRSDLAPSAVNDVKAGARGVDVRLSAGGRLEGAVSDANGAAIASFNLEIWQKTGPLSTLLVRSVAVLDPAGHFRVQGLPSGALQVSVSARGYAQSADLPVTVREDPAPATRLDVKLERGQRLFGIVSDASSQAAIAGARITLDGRNNGGDAPLRDTVQSGADGRFMMESLRPGQVTLLVSAAGHHARVIANVQVPASSDLLVPLKATEKGEKPKLELAGLGLVLSARDDMLAIGMVAPQGGGAEAGLRVGDGIVAINGQLVTEIGFDAAIQSIRGPENSPITLGVRRKAGADPVTVLAFRRLVRM